MSKNREIPPRWMNWLLELYCSKDLLEDLQGDLHEYYARNIKKSRFKANLIFLLDVIKFCRLYTIRKPKILGQMTIFNLLGNYFKTSTRSLARNKLFSSINILGLAISMSIGILMITYISELLSFDTFHEKGERIYRVQSAYKSVSSPTSSDFASTSVFIGKKLKEEYSGFEKVLLMRRNFRADISKGENTIPVRGHYASREFFDVFSFELTAGNPSTALSEPNSIVLTEKTAEKLFKDKQAIGQVVVSGEESYTVTGVVANLPTNSHIQFEALMSFITLENRYSASETTTFYDWRSIWMNYVYLLLPENADPDLINGYLRDIAVTENAKTDRYQINHRVESLANLVPSQELSNQIGPSMSWKGIYQLVFLTLFVIVSACFNYTNLSIARSLRRAKEVGVRKVVGAGRNQIFTQFVFEAIIVSLISVIMSFGLFSLIKPFFLEIVIDNNDLITMDFQWIHALYFVAFALFIGIVAGILPSIVLARLKAISIFRDASSVKLMKGLSLRKILIVLQFTTSIFLIIGSTIAYRQYKFALNFDMGFTTENVLNVALQENDSQLLIPEIEKLPEVSKISRSGMIPNTGEVWSEEIKYKDPLDSADVFVNYVDKNYFSTHEFTFLAGGSFPYDQEEGVAKFVVVDELLLKRFHFEDPQSAIGEVITVDRRLEDLKLEIIGVVSEFQYAKIHSESEPVALIQGTPVDYMHLNLVVKTDDVVAFMNKLEEIWSDVDRIHPFEARFYNELIQEAYNDQAILFKIFGFLAFLAISIATMGLLGMAVFTTETRQKEISVRKVLGASKKNLMFILSKGFIVMLLISAAIAMPLSYLFFNEMVMADFVNRIIIGPIELLSGVFIVFTIGILTIGWQTGRAARANPADMLRDE
ncbi:ABC transporter permease [Ekhidna sp.]|uniref:ABC transporter permease n=1 Tax=Ekhidna sp. TaxID=2608089 RepID=UPI0032988733